MRPAASWPAPQRDVAVNRLRLAILQKLLPGHKIISILPVVSHADGFPLAQALCHNLRESGTVVGCLNVSTPSALTVERVANGAVVSLRHLLNPKQLRAKIEEEYPDADIVVCAGNGILDGDLGRNVATDVGFTDPLVLAVASDGVVLLCDASDSSDLVRKAFDILTLRGATVIGTVLDQSTYKSAEAKAQSIVKNVFRMSPRRAANWQQKVAALFSDE